MERPSLTPMTYCEFEESQSSGRNRLRLCVVAIGRFGLRACRVVRRVAATDLFNRRVVPGRAIVVAVALRLIWLPPLLAGASAWSVYQATHPPQLRGSEATRLADLYGDRVALRTSDGVRLSALWVPAGDVGDIVRDGDAMLRERRPAVVLVHGAGNDARQMLPHVRALHAAGLSRPRSRPPRTGRQRGRGPDAWPPRAARRRGGSRPSRPDAERRRRTNRRLGPRHRRRRGGTVCTGCPRGDRRCGGRCRNGGHQRPAISPARLLVRPAAAAVPARLRRSV